MFGAWMLAGDCSDYKNNNVGNVKPAHEYGAFEVAARYTERDLTDGPVLGGREHNCTIGAICYSASHLKFQAKYVRAYSNKFSSAANRDLEIDPEVVKVRSPVYFLFLNASRSTLAG